MDEKPNGNIAVRVTYVFLIPICLYPLSVGPLVWLNYHNLIPESAIPILEPLYYPLALLYSADVPVLTPLYKSYISIWESLGFI